MLEPEQSWYWRSTSFTVGDKIHRYFPETVFKHEGQDIPGCCVDGESDSGPTCLTAEPEDIRTLNFATSYQIVSETFKFFDNGTFARTTLENTTNPAPDKSNYCEDGPGVVVDFVGLHAYNGNWQVVDAPEFADGAERLTFANITSSGTGAGFGHRGGNIYFLVCPPGAPRELALADPDPEGGGGFTFKFYVALDDDFVNSNWYPF